MIEYILYISRNDDFILVEAENFAIALDKDRDAEDWYYGSGMGMNDHGYYMDSRYHITRDSDTNLWTLKHHTIKYENVTTEFLFRAIRLGMMYR